MYKPRYSIPGYQKSEVKKERCHKKKIYSKTVVFKVSKSPLTGVYDR